MLISLHYRAVPECPFHIGCSPASSRCSDVPLVYSDFFFFLFGARPHINSWRTSSRRPFFEIYATARRADQTEFTALVAKLRFFLPFVCQFFSRGETSVTFPAAFKRRAVTISNQLGAYLYVNEGCKE